MFKLNPLKKAKPLNRKLLMNDIRLSDLWTWVVQDLRMCMFLRWNLVRY